MLHFIEQHHQRIRYQQVVFADQARHWPIVRCQPRLDEQFVAVHGDFLREERRRVEKETVILFAIWLEIVVLGHDCAEVGYFFEGVVLNAEITATEAPTAQEFEEFDLQVLLQVHIVNDQQNLF